MEANGSPNPQQTLAIDPIRIVLVGCTVKAESTPIGKQVIVAHPTAGVWIIPLDDDLAKALAGQLVGGIEIAKEMPK